MTDTPGVPSALGIEAVEWFPHDRESLTVRITGRWRRRRPTWSGQPLLVIEADGRRHPFPAMPEPPSLTGAAPGTWMMSFSVPAWLGPHLGGSAWLQLGAVAVPLPIEVEPVAAPAPEPPESADPAPDPGGLVEPRRMGSELSSSAGRREAAEGEEAAGELAPRIEQLEQARRAAEQRAHAERVLREELQDELARRARELSEDAAATSAVAALEEQVRELEAEIESLRRRGAEAEQLAAASRAARELAEPEVGALTREREQTARGPDRAQVVVSGLRAELAVAERSRPAGSPASRGAVEISGKPLGLRSERETMTGREGSSVSTAEGGDVTSVRLELEARKASEGRARAMLAAAQAQLDARSAVDRKLSSTLTELREELTELRSIAERESAGRAEAQAHVARLERELHHDDTRPAQPPDPIEALNARLDTLARLERELHHDDTGPVRRDDPIEELSARLDALGRTHAGESQARAAPPSSPSASSPSASSPSASSPDASSPQPSSPAAAPPPVTVESERLAAALVRLRQTTPPKPAASEPPATEERAEHSAKGWLRRVFRELTERDGEAAGRLALALLPAQRLTPGLPPALAYDLVLADVGCVQVTLASGVARVETGDAPRPPEEVQFQVTGDLASFARLLAARRIRRRNGRGMARVQGDRAASNALIALIRAPLHLRELCAAGVRMEPPLALSVVALMVDPSWTKGERFTIAHQEPGATSAGAYLHVLDGKPPSVNQTPPADSVATTIVCPPDSLLPVLDGAARTDTVLSGEERSLTLLQSWVKRAQSG